MSCHLWKCIGLQQLFYFIFLRKTIISLLMMPSVEMNRFTTIISFLMMPSVEMNRFTTIISITQIMIQKLYLKTFNIIIYICKTTVIISEYKIKGKIQVQYLGGSLGSSFKSSCKTQLLHILPQKCSTSVLLKLCISLHELQ